MPHQIEVGQMVFTAARVEGIGAVRSVSSDSLVIYVENSGEFEIPLSAVQSVHDEKVVLNAKALDPDLMKALGHVHDQEDPV
jgi:hypothetical protein